MKKIVLALLCASVFALHSNAQVKTKRTTKTEIQKLTKVKQKPPLIQISAGDLTSLVNESSRASLNKPFRFGKAIDRRIKMEDGLWESTNGFNIWSLSIHSPEAISINLIFDQFYLAEEAYILIYNNEQDLVYGPITSSSNRMSGKFATDVITGSGVTIELVEPDSLKTGRSVLSISKVVHGFRSTEYSGYGDSAPCHIDVNCEIGSPWHGNSNSVTRILHNNGQSYSSGALLNNECQDFTPYVLTAFHSIDTDQSEELENDEIDDIETWVFRFQYMSTTCSGGDDYNYTSISGATFRSAWIQTDFALVEMDEIPDPDSGIIYAGWSRTANPPTSSAALHHPRGDVMKISQDEDPAVAVTWEDFIDDTHWRVEFDDAPVEHGSSGSPLFDQNGRVVGQLHGNQNNQCFPSDNNDCFCGQLVAEYGRFDMSWAGGGTADTRLSDWLSTNGTATQTNAVNIPLIFSADYINGPDKGCYYQTMSFSHSQPVPVNCVFEDWDYSPKLNRIYGGSTSIGVYGVPGPYNGQAWVQPLYRNQCTNEIVLGARRNFTLYYDFNSGDQRVKWSHSSTSGYQELVYMWNTVTSGYIYIKFNDKFATHSVTKTSGDAYVIAGSELTEYDYYIYLPTVNTYNFFTFSGTELCGGESYNQTACFRVNGSLYRLENNPIETGYATLEVVPEVQTELGEGDAPLIEYVIVKDKDGNETFVQDINVKKKKIKVPISKKGINYITIVGESSSWSETHKVLNSGN